MTAKQEAYKKFREEVGKGTYLSIEDTFEYGWDAAIQWAVENTRTKDQCEGNTGSEYCNTVIDKQSILKGLE